MMFWGAEMRQDVPQQMMESNKYKAADRVAELTNGAVAVASFVTTALTYVLVNASTIGINNLARSRSSSSHHLLCQTFIKAELGQKNDIVASQGLCVGRLAQFSIRSVQLLHRNRMIELIAFCALSENFHAKVHFRKLRDTLWEVDGG